MEVNHKYKYFAFISYKREDEEWAKWLQHKLEHYKLPSNLNGRTDLPKEIRPVFKDTSELNPGNLPHQIHDALEQSKHLIVICSPRSAKSEWVNKEVETFMGMGKTDRIIPFIIDGKAFAKNPEEECFPLAIRNLPSEQEILGANIGEMGRDAAAVKVVAQMFGLKFDELWQRHEREQRRKRNWIIAVSIIGFLIMAGIAFWMYAQRQQTLKANWNMMENQARAVAEKAQFIVEEDSYLAQLLAVEVLPTNLEHPKRPYTSKAEALLRESHLLNTATLKNNNQRVFSASFSPDGKYVITMSDQITLWDALTGVKLKEYTEIGFPRSVMFSSDGERVLLSSYYLWIGYCVELLDLNLDTQFVHIEAPENIDINDVALSPDGKTIVLATETEVVFWDIEKNVALDRLAHEGIRSIAFSPSGEQIALGLEDHTVRIWDIKKDREIQKMTGHTDIVQCVAYSPDGKYVASASPDCTVKIWDAKQGTVSHTLKGHSNQVNSVSFSPDGMFIVSSSDDRSIRIWDTESGVEILVMEGHEGEVESAAFSPDGKRIVSASIDGTSRIWDFVSDSGIQTLKGHSASVKSIVYSPDGERIASASTDATIRIWDAEAGNILKTIEGHSDEINYISFSPDGKRIVSSSTDGTNKIWNVEGGLELEFSMTEFPPFHFPVDFSQDGENVLQAAYGGLINVWDAKTGDIVEESDLEEPGLDVYYTTASFSPDRKKAAFIENTRLMEFTVFIVDVESGEICHSFEGTSNFRSVAFSPDGKRLVTSSLDHLVKIWDVETETLIRTLDGHHSNVFFACYSPDGKHIVSGSDDNTIRVWDGETGAELLKLDWKYNGFQTAAFSPNGRNLIVGFADGTIKIIDFPPLQELIDQTRERFKDRPLTAEERRMYYLE